jgi:two-component system LytT family response regulator
MTVRAAIVDDEPLCRERVRTLLEGWREVEVVGECAFGADAVRLLRDTRIDLLFLDIELPDLNGFEVLEQADVERAPLVIFATAFSSYAVDAFEVYALDYLLKPIAPDRFDRAVARALGELASPGGPSHGERLAGVLRTVRPSADDDLERLLVRAGERLVFLRAADVDWFESAGNWVTAHVGKEAHLMRETMTRLEMRLGARRFLRIHRRALVNLDALRELRPDETGEYVALLRSGALLPVSRRCRQRIEAQFRR